MVADLMLDDRLESSLADEVVPFMSRHPLYTYMDRGRRKSLLQPCAAYFRTWISAPGHVPAVPLPGDRTQVFHIFPDSRNHQCCSTVGEELPLRS